MKNKLFGEIYFPCQVDLTLLPLLHLISMTNKMTEKSFVNPQSLIVTLNVDHLLYDKIHQLQQAGIMNVEINTHDEQLLTTVLQRFPQLRIGAGNILTTQELENCYQAGVHFASSPGFLPAIVHTAAIYSIDYLPGIATFSEAMQVMNLGVEQIRPCPASITFCIQLAHYFPQLRLFPADIAANELQRYLTIPTVKAVSLTSRDWLGLTYLSSGALA